MTAPLPPPNLQARALEYVNLSAGAVIERFYNNAHEPLYYDRSRLGRMNAPDASYGVLYAAADLNGAFAETFLRTPGRTLLPLDLIQRKSRVPPAPQAPASHGQVLRPRPRQARRDG